MYWHAPLWEVVLAVLMGLVFLGWLVIRALRRPDLSAALSAIDPALNDQPLLFFDRVKGITCLNDAAEQILNNLPSHPVAQSVFRHVCEPLFYEDFVVAV